METKEYYLSVNKEEARMLSENIARLYGFMSGYLNANMDPKHGPVNEIADIFGEIKPSINKLHRAMADQYSKIKDQNAVVVQAKQDMVNDIIKVLSSEATGLDLLSKLTLAISNYEIIGRKPFSGGGDEEEFLPF